MFPFFQDMSYRTGNSNPSHQNKTNNTGNFGNSFPTPRRKFRKMIRQVKKRNSTTVPGGGEQVNKVVLKSSILGSVLPSEQRTLVGSGPPVENSPGTSNQLNLQQGFEMGYDSRTQNHTQTSLSSSDPCRKRAESKYQFPELIVYGCPGVRGFHLLKKCFEQSPYGPLSLEVETRPEGHFNASLWWNGKCLAEGEGESQKEAQILAVFKLRKQLSMTSYTIELKESYAPRNRLPPHIRNVDPSNHQIFKVVYLDKPGKRNRLNLSGAIDYVNSEVELWKYIENHAQSQSKTDLFVLNVEKEDRESLVELFNQHGMFARYLNNEIYSRGVLASHHKNLKELMQELQACGGENIKFRLIPPGSDIPNHEGEYESQGEEYGEQQNNNVILNPPNMGSVLPSKPSTFFSSAPPRVENSQAISNQLNVQQTSEMEYNSRTQTFFPSSDSCGRNAESKGQFPELILYSCKGQKGARDYLVIKRSFDQSPYGPLSQEVEIRPEGTFKVSLWCKGQCLGEGEGKSKKEAERGAVFLLRKTLSKTNYTIELKNTYNPSGVLPLHIRNLDPSNHHILRVVCLKKPGETDNFFLPGAVDLVSSELELWKYVENHVQSQSKADIFVLNIERKDQASIVRLCNQNGMDAKCLGGCSGRGVVASRRENFKELMQELQACGGENVKYRLIPPGSDIQNVKEEYDSEGEESGEQQRNLDPPNLGSVLPNEPSTFFSSARPKLENSLAISNQLNFQQASDMGYDSRTLNETQTGFPCSDSYGRNTECKGQFPELILYSCNAKGAKGAKGVMLLKKCFDQSPYGPLSLKTEIRPDTMFKASLWCNGQCLSEGIGKNKKEAEAMAVYQLRVRLCKTNYVIELKRTYFSRHRLPPHILNVDPANLHILRVVYLKKPNRPEWFTISGAVDYVTSLPELWKYIDNHAKSPSKADIFVLNMEVKDRKPIVKYFTNYGMDAKCLVGCSNHGVVASHKENFKELMQKLQACGGENLKYRLITPGSGIQNIKEERESEGEEESGDEQQNAEQQNNLEKEEEIVIHPWISDNLILMDYYKANNELETARESIFLAVKNNPNLDEFIVEKTYDQITERITAKAMIDKHVVGIAKGFTRDQARDLAAENAWKNLKKWCYYIETKSSYLENIVQCPLFNPKRDGEEKNKIYRVARPEEGVEGCLKRFKTSHFQDLFFLVDFRMKLRMLAVRIAKEMGFRVRRFGRECVCVEKLINPKRIYSELVLRVGKENEKYRLHIPPARLGPMPIGSNDTEAARNIQALFDIGDKGVKQQQAIPVISSRIFQKPEEKVLTDSMSEGRTWQNNIQAHSNHSNREIVEHSSSFRTSNKRSFDQGPGENALSKPVQAQNISQQQRNHESVFSGERFVDQRSHSFKGNESNSSKAFNQDRNLEPSQKSQISSTNIDKPYNFEEDIWFEGEQEESNAPVSTPKIKKSRWETDDQASNKEHHSTLTSLSSKEPVDHLRRETTKRSWNEESSASGSGVDFSYGKKSRFSGPSYYGEYTQQKEQLDKRSGGSTEEKYYQFNHSSNNANYRGFQQQQDHSSTENYQSYYKENQQYDWGKNEKSVLPNLSDSVDRNVNVREYNVQVAQQQTVIQSHHPRSYDQREKQPGEHRESAGFNKQLDSSIPEAFDFWPNQPQRINVMTNQYNKYDYRNRPPHSSGETSDSRGMEQTGQSWNRTYNTSNQSSDVRSSVGCEKESPPHNPHGWMEKELERPTLNPVGRGQFNQQNSQMFDRDMDYYYPAEKPQNSMPPHDLGSKRKTPETLLTKDTSHTQQQSSNISKLFDLSSSVRETQRKSDISLSRDDRWSSDNRYQRDSSDSNHQSNRNWDMRDSNRSSGQRPIIERREQEKSSNQTSRSTGQLWNKDNKQIYDQRPQSEKESEMDFNKHFDGGSSKDFSQSTSSTASSRWQDKPRGHSFSKMNKYIWNARNK